MEGGGTSAPRLSLEPEPPAAAIKRFAMLDSSDEDNEDIFPSGAAATTGAGAAVSGGGDGGTNTPLNRFDKSKLDWSRMLDESTDSAPTPPPPLRAKTALAVQLNALGAPAVENKNTDTNNNDDAATPNTAATRKPTSLFRRLALLDSDGSIDGEASEGATRPPPSDIAPSVPPARDAGQRLAASSSLIPQSPVEVSAALPLLPPPPSSALMVSSSEKMKELATTDRSYVSTRTADNAAQVFRAPRKESPTVASAVSISSAPSAVNAEQMSAALLPSCPPLLLETTETTTATAPPHAKTRSIQRRPAALENLRAQQESAASASTTADAAIAAAPSSRAAESEPLSPGMVYTTVPRWTKGMKKRNGVYVSGALLVNPAGLYERGLKGLKRAEEKREELRAKLAEAERNATTFHPVISPRASALKRSTHLSVNSITTAELEMSQQLRHRLHLLELPEEAEATRRRSPRISATSARIVREHRERSSSPAMSPGDRLYQDFFYRQQAMGQAQAQLQPEGVPLVRSQREIAAHIAALYEFEEHRLHAIANAQAAPLPSSSRAAPQIYVDPHALVSRLTRVATPSPRRLARAQQVSDECTFQPRANANSGELAKVARLRGLQRWMRYFGGADTLTLEALLEYSGPNSREAQGLAAVLLLHGPSKTVWTAEELADAVAQSEGGTVEDLWRRRPPTEDTSASGRDLTFHPTLNTNSAAIVESMKSDQRCGPTHDRLFLDARSRQLTQRQRELEAEQAALEEAQRQQEKKARLQAEWRARERRRLEAYRAEQVRRRRSDVPLMTRQHTEGGEGRSKEAKDEAPPPHTQSPHNERRLQPTSRRLLLPSTSPEMRNGEEGEVEIKARGQRQSSPAFSEPVTTADTPTYAKKHTSANSVSSSKTKVASPATAVTPDNSAEVPASDVVALMATISTTEPATVASCAGPPRKDASGEKINTQTQAAEASVPQGIQELNSAAEALRRLLSTTAHTSAHASRGFTSTATVTKTATTLVASQQHPASSTPIAQRNINCPQYSKSDHRCLDVVLECATLRDPATVSGMERGQLQKAQRRQLRQLGRLLYSRNRARVSEK